MSSLKTLITIEMLTAVASVLGFIALSVVALAVANRFFYKQEQKFRKRQQQLVFPLIYRYLGGEDLVDEIQTFINGNWYAALAFQEIAFELIDDLKGSYKSRMEHLLRIEPLYSTYKKHLDSRSTWKVMDALYYFRHLDDSPDEIRKPLWRHLQSRSLELAHGSASALMRARNVNTRIDALKTYARRSDTTQQSFLEILHDFHRPILDQSEQESKIVPLLLDEEDLESSLKIALLRCVPQFGYVNQSDTIRDFLEQNLQQEEDPGVTAECIRVLGKLYQVRSAPLIRTISVQSPDAVVREACAFALGKFGTEEDHRQLVALLQDPGFDVRFEAARALSSGGGQVGELLEHLKDDSAIREDNIVFDVFREQLERESHRFRIQ